MTTLDPCRRGFAIWALEVIQSIPRIACPRLIDQIDLKSLVLLVWQSMAPFQLSDYCLFVECGNGSIRITNPCSLRLHL